MSTPPTIVDLVARAAAHLKGRSFIVVLSMPTVADVVHQILQDTRAVGVIVTDFLDAWPMAGQSQIGRRIGPGYAHWTFPDAPARDLVVIGGPDILGPWIARDALLRGTRMFTFVDPCTGRIHRRSIVRVAGAAAWRSSRARVAHQGQRVRRFVQRTIRQASSEASWCADDRQYSRIELGRKIVSALVDRCILYLNAKSGNAELGQALLERRFRRGLQRVFAASLPHGARAQTPSSDRVLLTIGTLGPGGSERQIVNTAVRILQDGRYRPIVACSNLRDNVSRFYLKPLSAAGIEVVDMAQLDLAAIEPGHRTILSRYRSALSTLPYEVADEVLRFLLVILRHRPCIVHSFLDDTNAKAGVAAVLGGVPRVILSTRSMAPDNFALHTPLMRPAYQALLARPEVLLCNNSDTGAADYRRWLNDGGLPITVLPNGIDFTTFEQRHGIDQEVRQRLGIPSGQKVLGSVLRLSEEKQPVVWAKVVLELSRRRPNVHFVLVGDGPLRSYVERIVANGRITSRVHILGQVTEVPAIMRALDVLLLTSRLEGLPNVLIEAQAVGVPVVTTPAGGAAEALDPERTGLVARDHSVDAIVESCLRLLDDDAMRQRFGAAGARFVREKFSIERMSDSTLRLYAGNAGSLTGT